MNQICAHKNIQEFTEICLDCGKNIYEKPKNIKSKKQKIKCEHNNVQDYTEICLDCGKNIWD